LVVLARLSERSLNARVLRFQELTGADLKYTLFGKPHSTTYRYAEELLAAQYASAFALFVDFLACFSRPCGCCPLFFECILCVPL
jgi:hypothetical protein